MATRTTSLGSPAEPARACGFVVVFVALAEGDTQTLDFLGWQLALLIGIPLALVVVAAAWRKLSRTPAAEVYELTVERFRAVALTGDPDVPVLAHCARPGNITNRAMDALVDKLAAALEGSAIVGVLDAEAHRGELADALADVSLPAMVLYCDGVRVLVHEGFFHEVELADAVAAALERYREHRSRAPAEPFVAIRTRMD